MCRFNKYRRYFKKQYENDDVNLSIYTHFYQFYHNNDYLSPRIGEHCSSATKFNALIRRWIFFSFRKLFLIFSSETLIDEILLICSFLFFRNNQRTVNPYTRTTLIEKTFSSNQWTVNPRIKNNVNWNKISLINGQ